MKKSVSKTKAGGGGGRGGGVAVLPGDCASAAAAAVFATVNGTRAANGVSADIMSVGGGVAFLDDDWIDEKQTNDRTTTTKSERVTDDEVKDERGAGVTTTSSDTARGNDSFHAPRLMATRRGLLHPPTPACAAWVETSSRRYLPAPGENVVGVVVEARASLPRALPLSECHSPSSSSSS